MDRERCGMTSEPQQFASDNYSGICPRHGRHAEANRPRRRLGDDVWTAKAADAFRALFETTARSSLPSCTAANSLAGLALASLTTA